MRCWWHFVYPWLVVLLMGVPAASSAEGLGAPLADAAPLSDTLDLSGLNASNRPAGRKGFVRRDGAVWRFDDGTEARFWGTNITAAAIFGTPHSSVPAVARQLAGLGYNLVRLHHHDSFWVSPNLFGDRAAGTDLNPEMLRRVDWWVACLKAQGISVWLDLHVQRRMPSSIRLRGGDALQHPASPGDIHGFNYLNPDVTQEMQRFNAAYLTHVNPFTGLAFVDDPAVVALLLTNENDLAEHYGARAFSSGAGAFHRQQYMAAAQAFARQHGQSPDAAMRPFRPGFAKVFLNDLEARWNRSMITHLRALGVKVPIVTTSYWGTTWASVPPLTLGDAIDVHAYEGTGFLGASAASKASALHTAAAVRVSGMPLTVSEWNMVDFPAADRQVLPLYWAAQAVQQGWTAVVQYAWGQVPLDDQATSSASSNWAVYNDPAMRAALPAAALMFRRADIAAQAPQVRTLTPSAIWDAPEAPAASPSLRTLLEQQPIAAVLPPNPALPWLKVRSTATAVTLPRSSLVQAIERVPEAEVFRITSPKTQAVGGRLRGQSHRLPAMQVSWDTDNAVVSAQALDELALGESKDIALTFTAPAQPARVLGPISAGNLRLEAPAGLTLTRCDDGKPALAGVKLTQKAMLPNKSSYFIELTGELPVHCLRLQAQPLATLRGHR